jgi:tRNA dimethylallyltransferase
MRAFCLYGPTGSGKSALAMAVARDQPVEIVSVDSAMVYRGMDIGTAKPGAAERAAVPHHLLDLRDPWEHYSAGAFRRDALAAIADIVARGRMPLLVGGTLLYFRALWQGLAELPQADPVVREALADEAARRGWPALHAQLAALDPVSAARIRPADRQRIQRALEVYRLTGRPLSALLVDARPVDAAQFVRIALLPADRTMLYRQLDARFDAMLAAGLPAEVRHLMESPRMSPGLPSMRAVGYRQLWRYLAGETSLNEARQAAQRATRQLAKRQLTWMRSEQPDASLPAEAADLPARLNAVLQAHGVSRRA